MSSRFAMLAILILRSPSRSVSHVLGLSMFFDLHFNSVRHAHALFMLIAQPLFMTYAAGLVHLHHHYPGLDQCAILVREYRLT